MALQVDQELRRDLLLKALEACSDPDEALDNAVRMERFILDGHVSSKELDGHVSSKEEAPADQENGSTLPQQQEKKKAHTRPRWTPDDDSHLQRLWQEKVSVEAIAERLQRTPAGIYGRVRQLGFSTNERGRGRSSQETETGEGTAQRTDLI
jgi:hypothetical protein